MSKAAKKSYLVRFLVLAILFFSIILFVLINFSISKREAATTSIETSLMHKAEGYASQFQSQLNLMAKIGLPTGFFMLDNYEKEEQLTLDAIKKLKYYSGAYQVIYSDEEGLGVTQDGMAVDLSKETYFNQIQNRIIAYSYTKQDCVEKKEAIVIIVPLILEGKSPSHLFLYYKPQELDRLFPQGLFYENMLFLLIQKDGEIIGKYGNIEGVTKESNFYDAIQKNVGQQKIDEIKNNIEKSNSGILTKTINHITQKLFYTPIGLNDWYLVMEVNGQHIERLEESEWKETKDFTYTIIFIMSTFIILVIVIGITQNTKQKEHNKALEMKSETDLLTGLYNKITTERKIKEYIQRYPTIPAMMFVLDIDNFKNINDTMGHAFGDEVLKALGYGLKAEFRASDIIGRTGGDEFVVFLKDIKDENIRKKETQRFIWFFKNFQVGEYVKYNVTVSIGRALFPQDSADFDTLYKAADAALYKAKKRGKNQLASYHEEEEEEKVDLQEDKEQ